MCDLKACRICLTNNSKFYKIDDNFLKLYYEELTTLPVPDKDGIPRYFCFECTALLRKFHRFREKCYEGEKVLREMLFSGPITYAGICKLNARKVHKCQYGNLEIIVANERVKTYHFQHSEIVKKGGSNETKEDIDIEYSDGPYSEDNESECKDPETDPVPEENMLDLKVLKPDDDKINDIYKEVHVVIKTDVEVKLLKQSEVSIEEVHTEKPKKVLKSKKVRQTKRTRNAKRKRKQRSDDYDSDSEKLSTIKSRNAVSATPPDRAKKYKFNKPYNKLKNLAFLDSGFWKKSNLTEEEAFRSFEAKSRDRKYLNAAFQCTLCYKGFSQLDMLERHIPKRHGEAAGKLECRICKMRFTSKYFLNKHMKQHYTKYECLRCDLVCTLENTAIFHEEYHNGVVRKCSHCDKEFRHLSTFYTHLRTHRSKHMCALCGESFVSDLGLRLHRKAKHVTDNEPSVQMLPENMYCDICQIKFETKDAYEKHLAHSAMHTDQNKISDDNLAVNLLEDDEKKDDKGKSNNDHKIEELHKRRSRVEETLCAVRKKHLPRTTSKKPTTCHHCEQHFETQSACMKHHLAMHPRKSFFSPTERVICEICGASLAPGSVASHLNQHTRSKMYTCDTCGRSFTTSTMLRTHMVTHTGEKPFACTLCDKRFTQNGSLSLHYRTYHLKQPYPKRNRRKNIDKPNLEGFNGKEKKEKILLISQYGSQSEGQIL